MTAKDRDAIQRAIGIISAVQFFTEEPQSCALDTALDELRDIVGYEPTVKGGAKDA